MQENPVVIIGKTEASVAADSRWVTGEIFGIDIPADLDALVADAAGGVNYLTRAFHRAGSLAPDNRVVAIVDAQEFVGGGTGKKALLTLAYESAEPDLPEALFIKFSRNFDNELWDRARHLMVSEAHFAVLSRSPDFPVAVPRCLFADVDPASGTGLIITERIRYGEGNIAPLYPKCMDYQVPDALEHYKAILKGLARLSGTHRAGKLPPEFDERFPYDAKKAAAIFTIPFEADKVVQWAERMFDFVERYPQLFPEQIRDPALREQFIADLPDVLTQQATIRKILYGNPDLIAFAHWNANIDNCWFWRDDQGELHCGFMDWANASPISVAQSISGAISGAEPELWNDHLDELLGVFIEEYAACGGPHLNLEELRLHVLLIVVMSGVAFSMRAPVAIEREIADVDALESDRDEQFKRHENARIQLHMMTKMLNVWHAYRLGDVVRGL